MIELKIDGVCKECPFRNLALTEYSDPPGVRCKHDHVCKFVGDPHGEEALEATTKLIHLSIEEGLKAASERNTDA